MSAVSKLMDIVTCKSIHGYVVRRSSFLSAKEDILIKKLLISHDPDSRRLDSQQLLRAMENIMCYTTSSHEIFCKRSSEGDLHTKTMHLLEFLEKYNWDVKVVLVLAAFGFKFESLPISELELDSEAKKTVNKTKFHIHLAAYWVTRSSLVCSRQIKDFIAMKFQSEYSNSTTIAAWELSSLVCRLSSINSCLEQQVDECYKLIEEKMHEKLWEPILWIRFN